MDPTRGQSGKIRVLIVDDHIVVRQAISARLNEEPDIEVIDQAASCGEMVESLVRSHRPHVVLMDVRMAGIGGVEATRRIKRCCPSIKVLALSMSDDPTTIRAMRAAGADEFLHKSMSLDDLLRAVRQYGSTAQAA